MLRILIAVALLVSPSSGVQLSCDEGPSNFTCPNSTVSCRCTEAQVSLSWRVRLAPDSTPIFQTTFSDISRNESSSDDGLYTAVASTTEVQLSSVNILLFMSTFWLVLMETVIVECDHNGPPVFVLLQPASYPSAPQNLIFTQISILTDTFAVRLDWDPPQMDGGMLIANYLILVNGSQMDSTIFTRATNVALILNSTEKYMIEISAINECGLFGNSASVIVSAMLPTSTASEIMTTRTSSTTATTVATTAGTINTASPLTPAAIVGVVVALLVFVTTAYICGILTGLLVQKKKNHTPSTSNDLSAPTYEQVLPPTQTSFSLKENEAYGHFNS